MTPEGKVKEAVKSHMRSVAAYKHMPVQNGMGEPALDFHVCKDGYYAAVETKAGGKKPTPRQIETMRRVHKSGGSVFLIDSIEGPDMAAFIMWLAFPQTRYASPAVLKAFGENDESRDD
jgi:hypothetical protein